MSRNHLPDSTCITTVFTNKELSALCCSLFNELCIKRPDRMKIYDSGVYTLLLENLGSFHGRINHNNTSCDDTDIISITKLDALTKLNLIFCSITEITALSRSADIS